MTRTGLIVSAIATLLAPLCFGQANLATLTGVVADPGGGVIPGADVTVINTGTGISREQSTNAVGSYTFPALIPGDYQLIVTSEGFQQHVEQGIVLSTGDNRRVDVELQLGQLTESVTVDAQLVTLNTESGTIKGDVIVMEEIQELPLAGRDFTDLAFFVPGVIPKAEGGQGSFANINGARASNTNFYVDGFDNRNARGSLAQVRPNIDALQEFKMEVSGYSAEYGRMAGGILNMSLRSGTNALHGNVNYFLRNDVLDARGFFEADKNKLRRNQFAATATGPIVKNKSFFLLSYEGLRQIQDFTRITRVPTALERTGDFSESLNWANRRLFLRDRLARGPCHARNMRSCFKNNLIPASRMDPIGLAIQSHYPGLNFPAGAIGFNYRTSPTDEDKWNSYIVKIDQKVGENSLAFRYQIRHNDVQNRFAGGSDLGDYGAQNSDNRSLGGVDYTHMFSPTFLMEVRSGFSRNSAYNRGYFPGQDIPSELGLPNLIPEAQSANLPELLDWPRFVVSNFAQIGTGANQPVQFHITDWQWGIKFSWIVRGHTIKFGFNNNYVQFNQPFFNNQRGSYIFRGRRTMNPLADLQLGWLHNVNRQLGFNRNYWRQHALGAFVNDDWKATRNLTLNLGMRWEVNRAPADKYDRLGVYDTASRLLILASDENVPSNYSELLEETGLASVITTAQAAGRPRSVIKTDWNNFSPRMGFAYRVSEDTVVRGGYSIFVAGDILNNLRNNLSNQFPFAVVQNFPGVSARPNEVSLQNPFPTSRERLAGTTSVRGYDLNPSTGYLQSWNFTIERALFGNTSIEMDYRGSKGTFLIRRYDFNQPYRTADSFIAGEGYRRPIPEWNAIQIFGTGANSNYNAFNASWRKRSRGGLFWRANYSFSKSIDDASQANGQSEGGFPQALDSRNLWLDRGRSDWDRRHVFTAVGNYNLPFGKGRRWGKDWRGVTQYVIGGWQLSGTASAYSGSSLTVTTSNPDLNLGESQRPNRIAHGRVSKESAPGKKGVDFPWYDLNAFKPVPSCLELETGVFDCATQEGGFTPFAFGNSGRNILDGPGLVSINTGLSKNFVLKEGHRLQIRIETFNIANRTNFIIQHEMKPFNSPTAGLLSAVGNVGRGGGPRVWQYAVKYRF